MHTYIGAGYRFKNIGFNVKDIVDFFLGRHRYSRYLSSTKSSIVIDYKFLIGNFNSDVIRTVFSSSYSDRIAVVNTINSLRDNYNFVNDISKYFYKNVKTKTDGSWFYKIFINFFDIRNSNLDLNLDKSVEVVDYLGVDYNLVFKPLFLDFSRVLADYLLIKNNCNFKFFEVYGFPILSPLEFEGLYYRYSTKDYSFNNHVSNPVVTNRESRPLGVIIDIINRRINDSVSGQHNSTYMKKFDFILLGSFWYFFFVWFKNEWRLFYKYLSELPICPTIHLFNNFDSSYSNVVDKYYLISKIVTNQIVTPSSSFGVAFGYNCIENYKGDHFHTSYFNQIVGFEGESYSKTLSLVNDSISRKFINFS